MDDKSSKRLPVEMERAVARFVKDIVTNDFPPNMAGKAKGQREIAHKIGLSQPVLSKCLKYDPAHPTPLGLGVNGLIALRRYSHQSIDAILGLEMPSAAVDARDDLEKLLASTEEIGGIVTSLVQKPSPSSKLGRALREVERIKGRLVHLRREEERIRRVNEPTRKRGAA